MIWRTLSVSVDASHHVDGRGAPAYAERFDEVLKFHAPGLAPVLRGGLAWHIGENGTEAYTRRFTRTFGFYEGLASVIDSDGWHHIHVDGRDAYAQRYAWTGNVQNGRCPVRERDGGYHHIDVEGCPVYATRWRYAGDFRDGVAVVQAGDGRSTHIDPSGALIHERWFLDLDVFHKGFARARDDGGWMHVDLKGQPIYERRFVAVEPFYNGQARVERFDGGLEVIDERGRALVELRAARRSEHAEVPSNHVGDIDWVIPPSTLAWLEQSPGDRPVAMLVRHSVRGDLPPGDAGYMLPITDVGHRLARELGTKLLGRLRGVHASPLLRTMQTAERLAEGAGRPTEVVPDRMLGDPGAFVVDARAGATWLELGHEEVMRRLVHGDEVLPGCADAEAAARALVHHMLTAARGEPGLHVFVTHDSLVTATAARLLGEPLTKADWPWYLEAAFFWEDGDAVHVGYRERRSALPRPLVGLTEDT